MIDQPVSAPPPLLEVRDVVKHFPIRESGLFGRQLGAVRALNGVSLTITAGETLAVVGESGCGKSTLARVITLLLKPDRGSIRFDGKSALDAPADTVMHIRRRLQLIFQDPYGSLNPRLSINDILAEPLKIHTKQTTPERTDTARSILEIVGLQPGDLNKYPHQFSGGQRQRIAIARALISEPDLIIADEPLSALDASIQSQIINLFMSLKETRKLSYLFISHDLSVVSHLADRVMVMYMGRVVESCSVESLFTNALHPYSRLLISAAPQIGRFKRARGRIQPGETDSNEAGSEGCPFQFRCAKVQEICRVEPPELQIKEIGPHDHLTACHFPGED